MSGRDLVVFAHQRLGEWSITGAPGGREVAHLVSDLADGLDAEIDSHIETAEIMRRIRDERDVLRRKIAAIRPLAEAWADPNAGDEILAILDGGDPPADGEVNA